MPGTFYAGKDGSASIGGVTQYCRKWELSEEAGEHDVTNMRTVAAADGSKWREFIGGFVNGTLTMDCVHDPTLSRGVRGSTVTYTAVVGDSYGFSGNGVLRRSRTYTDVDGVAMISYEIRLTGSPTVV